MDAHTDVLEVIDAHHHFWEPEKNYHPWLRDEPQISFRYGNYRALKKPYLPEDYLADSVNFRVIGTVYVETEWARGLAAEELAYIDGLRRRNALPTVAVAQAWLDEVDIDAQIEAITQFDFVRGIRHKPKSNPAPTSTSPSGMASPHWRRGFARLQPAGLRFDLQTPWWHFPEAARLACDFPQTQIIINHTGLPGDRSPEGIEAWSKAMREVSQCGNVTIKISGLGVLGEQWTTESNRDIVLRTIDLFGIERCMFASNFPVDSLCATFDQIYGGFRNIVSGFTSAEQSALFVDNARRIYDIRDP